MTRELLTAQGNLFTNGPVAYYFIDEKIEDLAETTAQVFLGVRLQCTRCHHHPHEVWSQEDYYGLAAFFTRLEAKDSGGQGAKFGGPKSIRASEKPNPNRQPKVAVAPRVLGETGAWQGRSSASELVPPASAAASRSSTNARRLDHASREPVLCSQFREPLLGRTDGNGIGGARR